MRRQSECVECGQVRGLNAHGQCDTCYSRHFERKRARCADCRAVKEIRAHGMCSTCYSRRVNVGYRFDGPPPEVGPWGYKGPCIECGELDEPRYIRLRCRPCYLRFMYRLRAQEYWRSVDAYLQDKTSDEIYAWIHEGR